MQNPQVGYEPISYNVDYNQDGRVERWEVAIALIIASTRELIKGLTPLLLIGAGVALSIICEKEGFTESHILAQGLVFTGLGLYGTQGGKMGAIKRYN